MVRVHAFRVAIAGLCRLRSLKEELTGIPELFNFTDEDIDRPSQ